MAEDHVGLKPESPSELSGQNARRKFLKMSGRTAIAAPAAVLLLAAANKSALAQVAPYTINGDDVDAVVSGPAGPVRPA